MFDWTLKHGQSIDDYAVDYVRKHLDKTGMCAFGSKQICHEVNAPTEKKYLML